MAKTVEDPAEEIAPHADESRFFSGDDAVAKLQSNGFLEGHREHTAVSETHNLAADRATVGGVDLDEVAEGDGRALRLDQEADHLDHFARPAHRLKVAHVFEVRL